MENPYRYRLSLLADMEGHIGSLADIINWIGSGIIFDERIKNFHVLFSYQILFRPKSLILAFSFHKKTGEHLLKKIWGGIGNLLVLADKKIRFIGGYRYRPIWKKAYRSYTE